ncbi:MAG: choice-of-anchor D domain-containing protein [Candidatus Kapabacteria bacterium]|nr:choice-of-anchor D domain-containing protein [Candidatus Kapabacteria bacterium]
MKKYLLLIIFFIPGILLSQSLTIFDVDASNFPTIRAKFYAFDAEGKLILNLAASDFELLENGVNRTVSFVSCPTSKLPQTVSIAMSIDNAVSMAASPDSDIPIELGKTFAKELCYTIAMPPSEFALLTCNDKGKIIHDFSTNKSQILSSIDPIKASNWKDFVEHLLNEQTGLLNVAKTGKNKRVAVLYTDALWHTLTQQELQQCKDTCSKYNITFFAVTNTRFAANSNGIKKSLQELADFTDGILYKNVTVAVDAKEIARKLQLAAQSGAPCEIEWESGISCIPEVTIVELQLKNLGLKATASYQIPDTAVGKLEFSPTFVKFLNPKISFLVEEKVIVTARNADFNVTNIIGNNAAFTIKPINFVLNSGQSIELTVSYLPADSGYNYCRFEIENDVCPTAYYVSGGYRGKKSKIQTLKLTNPNGSEAFIVGSDTIITWEGIPPSDKVLLEYSTDNGQNWQTITNNASGLSHNWTNIPRPVSSQCLIRVSQRDANPNNSTPKIEWQRTYGGSENDIAIKIQETSDGGFVLAGWTQSNDGDISENNGEADVWVLKIRFDGNIEWQKTYGGSYFETANSIQETRDGGYIVAGSTNSNNTDITENKGETDAWVLKLNIEGNIEWQKTYGGSLSERVYSIRETNDGGFIVAGVTESIDGDVTENKGGTDAWVLKLNIEGNIEWQKTYGGSLNEMAYSIQETSDGGYIVAGETESKDGDILVNKGQSDLWVLKLSNDGEIEWQKTFGGSGIERTYSIQMSREGGFIVAAYTYSADGDVKENKGSSDIWVLKLSIDGSIEWQKTYGGRKSDMATVIQETIDGGFIVAGFTNSVDGNLTENKGGEDIWVLKLINDGSIEWQKTWGGSSSDRAASITETNDGRYIIAGSTHSKDGDIKEYKGWSDVWVIKLASNGTILQSDVSDAVFSIVEPIAASRDIDMLKVLVGTAKDSVVNEFVSNVGTWKFRVDSIYIQGADASAFSLVAGFPQYTIEPNDSYFGEFRFVPNRVGLHSAEIVIVTQAETIVQNIIGEGVEPRLETIAEIIDFGIVDLGQFKDTIQAATIKNIGTNPIMITETKHNYPNAVDFSTLSGGGNFILQPGQEALMDLRFTANSPGRTSGTLEFHYDGVGSPAVVQLFGEGKFMGMASAQLKTIEIEAYAGDLINIPIILDFEVDLSLSSVNTIDVEMQFNPTLLYPQDLNMEIINNNLAKILIKDLPANKSAGEVLGEVAFIVGLGNSETCDITLINPISNGGDADISLQSGHFRLLGVCYEGGTRLLNPYSKAGILSIAPNPADDNLDIVVSLIESGMTELSIYNTMGEKISTVFSTSSPPSGIQYYNLDTKLLSTGQYYLQLRTPTHIENQIIKIVK